MGVPAEDPRRLPRRRAITLDLFTRYGRVWSTIRDVRHEWSIEPTITVPPVPSFSASDCRLLTRSQMPERFHLPSVPPDGVLETVRGPLRDALDDDLPDDIEEDMSRAHVRIHVWQWLMCLRDMHDEIVPEGNPSGTDVQGWLTWVPFLSACVLFDPPESELLTFADHDDHEAAKLTQLTFHQDARAAVEVERNRSNMVSKSSHLQDQVILHALGTQRMASTYKPSTIPAAPSRRRGRPMLDELVAVQCALWKRRGWTHHAIAEAFGWKENPESMDPRHRKNKSEDHVKRGERILLSRKYSG